MESGFLNIGFSSYISVTKIIGIVSPDSAPIRRMIRLAKEQGRLVDATFGRRTRAAILTEGGFIVLSAVLPDTLVSRLEEEEEERIEPITEQEAELQKESGEDV
ncbi:MAG TPA: DUF370 domain-containing protein [Coprothermobacter proteolyticus]|uniref:DUF370 domain-containing protein n=1 Tax=Coprothermobacter proteolyticus TaxID=35786 RepID=UPI000D3208BC|nr:DUF370 domain-containing protein [Coprothermobacter proteolyticus]NLT83410.1 DUF370 domain-containing protein [Coprothermobacter proteolyticus]HAR39771.1 DUF370 domain-containing protein [Coprothermobacter sp.]HOP45491.1 DUF370 domain-containing protein [Coprothermobacter proteolyticus]HRC95841.1 DUF370 domain-containing protein [Coprothermobacter proteolyticus]